MKPIASQGQFSSRFILVEATMASTTESTIIDGQGLTLVGLELPAAGAAGTASIQEVPRFIGSDPLDLRGQDGNIITVTTANADRIYRFSPLLFPSVGQIRLKLTTSSIAAGTTIGFLFIKPQGER